MNLYLYIDDQGVQLSDCIILRMAQRESKLMHDSSVQGTWQSNPVLVLIQRFLPVKGNRTRWGTGVLTQRDLSQFETLTRLNRYKHSQLPVQAVFNYGIKLKQQPGIYEGDE